MKRKLVALGIVSLFLVISFSSYSAIGTNKKEIEKEEINEDDLPDLTVELVIDSEDLTSYWLALIIHNNGTTAVPAGTYIVAKSVGGYSKEELKNALNPGDSIKYHNRWIYFKNERDVVRIEVDPPAQDGYPFPELNPNPIYGIIDELNEDNNIGTFQLKSMVRSYNNRMLFFSLVKFIPIFSKILEKLSN